MAEYVTPLLCSVMLARFLSSLHPGSSVEGASLVPAQPKMAQPKLLTGATFQRGVEQGTFGLDLNPSTLEAEMAVS